MWGADEVEIASGVRWSGDIRELRRGGSFGIEIYTYRCNKDAGGIKPPLDVVCLRKKLQRDERGEQYGGGWFVQMDVHVWCCRYAPKVEGYVQCGLILNGEDMCNNADISKLYAIQLFNLELKWGEG